MDWAIFNLELVNLALKSLDRVRPLHFTQNEREQFEAAYDALKALAGRQAS